MNADGSQAAPVSPERFVWPPRPLDDSTSIPPLRERRESVRPATPPVEYPELVLDRPGRLGRLVRAWREVEATWLGFAAAPLAVRAAEAGWSPDAPGAYCPRCGTSVGPDEVLHGVAARPFGDCPACRRRNLPWERMIRLGEHAGLLRELVHDVKFTAWRQVGVEMGRMLGRSIGAAMEQAHIDPKKAILVPMPTTYPRRMVRGIDHARVVARGVRDITGLPLIHALDRSHRRSQRSVPVSRRAANVAGSIRPVPGVGLGGCTVIVIDDVRTTGATMNAACRAIAQCTGKPPIGHRRSASDRDGLTPRIWAAVLAVAPRPGQRAGTAAESAPEDAGIA